MGASAGPTPYGDSAPSMPELSKIIGHAASIKEHNIARGIHVDPLEKTVHDRASAAVAQLDISPEVRVRILGEMEREAVAIRKRAKKNGGDTGHGRKKGGGITLEKAVAFAFLRQCRGIGRSVEEMQRALARAGFGIRLESVHIMIASHNPDNLSLFVNDRERTTRIARPPKLVRVPIYLSDLLEDDYEEGEVEIRVSGDGAIIGARSPYEFDQPDWQTLRVFAGRRCFYLFKAQQDVTVRPDWAATGAAKLYREPSVNVEAVMKRFLPSKFPISSMVMDAAGCLREVELRFISIFREMIKDAHGRSPEKAAVDALYLADQDVFDSLPIEKRSLAQSMLIRLSLARGNYAGKVGLLLKSEVGFEEVRRSSEEGGRSGGTNQEG